MKNNNNKNSYSNTVAIIILLATTICISPSCDKFAKNKTKDKDLNNFQSSHVEKNSFIAIDTTMLEIQPDTLDFGKIKQGEIVIGEFTLINLSAYTQSIVKIDTECGCTVAKYSTHPIEPSSNTHISVEFDSTSKYGMQMKSMNIKLEPAKISKKVIIKAEVIV